MTISRAVGRMFLFGLVMGLSGGCVGPGRVSDSAPPANFAEYRLAPPDQIQIVVRGVEPPIERLVTVRPDGKISMDLIGELEVLGKTMTEVRSELQDRLRKFIVEPEVTAILSQSNSRRYFVLGEVGAVGAYPLVGEVTAIEALATAGGPTFLANINGAWLSRPGGEGPGIYRIRFNDITRRSDGRTNYVLQPGDVIYVPPGVSAQIGNALRVIFYPLQQVVGLGGRFVTGGRTGN